MQNVIVTAKDGTKLTALLANPQAKKSILISPGWAGKAEFFTPLANLMQEYRILILNLRGHGGSEGIISTTSLVSDIEAAISQYLSPPVIYIAHSFGAMGLHAHKLPISTFILFNPYLGKHFLDTPLRETLNKLDFLSPASKKLDLFYHHLGLNIRLLANPVQQTKAVIEAPCPAQINQPTLVFVSDRDLTFGTYKPTRDAQIKELVSHISTNTTVNSTIVKGLNHNMRKMGSQPFLGDCPEVAQAVVDEIRVFLRTEHI